MIIAQIVQTGGQKTEVLTTNRPKTLITITDNNTDNNHHHSLLDTYLGWDNSTEQIMA